MTDVVNALDRLRAANPVAAIEVLDPHEVAASREACRDRIDTARRINHVGSPADPSVRPARRVHPALGRPAIAFAAAFAVMVVAVTAAVFVGRNGGEPAEPMITTTVPPVSTTTQATTTVPPTTTTLRVTTLGGVNTVAGIEYYSDTEATLTMSVHYPADGEGPWPVAVVYHDFCVQCAETSPARDLASRGAVVFTPTWVLEVGEAGEYVDGATFDRAVCALGAAQRLAPEFGGAAEATTVIGSGGGEHPATWAALNLARDAACEDPTMFKPTGLIVGEPQFIFQEEDFDDAFAEAGSNAPDTIDRFLNPARWDPAENLSVVLWATAYVGNSRAVAPDGSDSWLTTRDTTGTLVDDLAAVGAFDDGLILFDDNIQLMNARLSGAGIESRLILEDRAGWLESATVRDGMWEIISRDM